MEYGVLAGYIRDYGDYSAKMIFNRYILLYSKFNESKNEEIIYDMYGGLINDIFLYYFEFKVKYEQFARGWYAIKKVNKKDSGIIHLDLLSYYLINIEDINKHRE